MTGAVLNGARQMTLGIWAAPRACASGGSSCATSVASVLFRRISAVVRGTGTSHSTTLPRCVRKCPWTRLIFSNLVLMPDWASENLVELSKKVLRNDEAAQGGRLHS